MLKYIEGLKEKMQDESGFWTEQFENGFLACVKDGTIETCTYIEKSSFESCGYNLIWVDVDKLGENPEEALNYIESQISTLDVQQTLKNLLGIELVDDDISEFANDIICAFDTTEKEVLVSCPDEMNSFNGRDGIHSAYENLEDSPIIKFKIQDGKIVDAWED